MTFKKHHLFVPNQLIPIRFLNGQPEVISQVKSWMLEVFQYVNLKFLWFDVEANQSGLIRIALEPIDQDDSEWAKYSAVGTEALMHPSNRPTLNLSSVSAMSKQIEMIKGEVEKLEAGTDEILNNRYPPFARGTRIDYLKNTVIPHYERVSRATTLHEACHAIGAIHEHLRPDSFLMECWKTPEMAYDMSELETVGSDYNTSSIMHYNHNSYKHLLKTELPEQVMRVPFNYDLSEEDILSLLRIYSVDRGVLREDWGSIVTRPISNPKEDVA